MAAIGSATEQIAAETRVTTMAVLVWRPWISGCRRSIHNRAPHVIKVASSTSSQPHNSHDNNGSSGSVTVPGNESASDLPSGLMHLAGRQCRPPVSAGSRRCLVHMMITA